MIRIDDYKLLLQLNEIGTVRGTARHILISQPAVSQRLKFIEEHFGETIFIRTSKKLQLTPSGEIILKHAEQIIQMEEELQNKLAKSSEHVSGTLSIACSSVVSQRYLPKILAKFTQKFPLVSIDLVTGLSEQIKDGYDQYHVSIVRGNPIKDSKSILLFEDPLYIFDTEPITEEDIKTRPLIFFKSDHSMEESMNSWITENLSKSNSVKKITVDQIETCKQFMKQGLGMAILPMSVSEPLMDHYHYFPLEVDKKKVTRKTWLCFHKGVRQLPQVDHFIDLILEESFE
ncbi:MAG TPA: LysR family transcriptional regulator [Pseudogracilibacillus sp.]|nr:LysR family transcriptional regulator [Pseudogracilibacillus sp.]